MVDGRWTRRRVLHSALVAGSWLAAGGCRPADDPTETPPPASRSDIPLRVLVCGDAAWGEAISIAWGGISQQPLQITLVDPTAHAEGELVDAAVGLGGAAARSEKTSPLAAAIQSALRSCDVAIVPAGLIADLEEQAAIVPLADDLLHDQQLQLNSWFPVLRQSLMPWGGRPLALPLGCPQPALFTAAGYQDAAETDGGATTTARAEVALPVADGAAAKLFLWQANLAQPPVWLFDRASLQPVIDQPVYVQTLTALQAVYQLAAAGQPLSAGDVWSRIAADDFSLAIAWPATSGDPPRLEPLPDVAVNALPPLPTAAAVSADTRSDRDGGAGEQGNETAVPLLVDVDAPLGVISTSCRQSSAAKRFLVWLAVGEGRQMVRAAIPGLTPLADAASTPDSPDSHWQPYDRYLQQRLASVSLRPSLRLHAYDRYLASLDLQIQACLRGEQTPQQALQATAETWSQLTAEIGSERQAKAWRRAQGLRN